MVGMVFLAYTRPSLLLYWLRIDRKDTVGCAGSRTPQKFSRYGVVWVMGIRWEMYFLTVEGTELVRK